MRNIQKNDMQGKLDKIFEFINENRRFNIELQYKFCRSMIGYSEEPTDKLISLLYHEMNTQNRPRMDPSSEFFQMIYSNVNKLKSFESFISLLNGNQKSFGGLFECLKNRNGWGPKTSALFSKNIYLIHNKYNNDALKFWEDVPTFISDDKFYLPVDKVILTIFNKLDVQEKWNFNKINGALNEKYSNEEIIIWDDLWFWGFFNQKVAEKQRTFEWNESKYWTLKETDKSKETIETLIVKSKEFREIIEN